MGGFWSNSAINRGADLAQLSEELASGPASTRGRCHATNTVLSYESFLRTCWFLLMSGVSRQKNAPQGGPTRLAASGVCGALRLSLWHGADNPVRRGSVGHLSLSCFRESKISKTGPSQSPIVLATLIQRCQTQRRPPCVWGSHTGCVSLFPVK